MNDGKDLLKALDELKSLVAILVSRSGIKTYLSVAEVAHLVGKAPYTVRQWCRLGRLNAEKQLCRRGKHAAYVVSMTELQRYEKEGLLPLR
jgi:hypothetical protein